MRPVNSAPTWRRSMPALRIASTAATAPSCNGVFGGPSPRCVIARPIPTIAVLPPTLARIIPTKAVL